MPVSTFHYVEDLLNIVQRDILMKKIAHRIDEDRLRLFPAKRPFEHMRLERKLETICIVPLTHRLQTSRHLFRVAILTARTKLVTAGHRVPGRLGPFDC